jgi:hypothetical protein
VTVVARISTIFIPVSSYNGRGCMAGRDDKSRSRVVEVADRDRIRGVTPRGLISTNAGVGFGRYMGDGGPDHHMLKYE